MRKRENEENVDVINGEGMRLIMEAEGKPIEKDEGDSGNIKDLLIQKLLLRKLSEKIADRKQEMILVGLPKIGIKDVSKTLDSLFTMCEYFCERKENKLFTISISQLTGFLLNPFILNDYQEFLLNLIEENKRKSPQELMMEAIKRTAGAFKNMEALEKGHNGSFQGLQEVNSIKEMMDALVERMIKQPPKGGSDGNFKETI